MTDGTTGDGKQLGSLITTQVPSGSGLSLDLSAPKERRTKTLIANVIRIFVYKQLRSSLDLNNELTDILSQLRL